MDGNKVIVLDAAESIPKIKDFEKVIQEYKQFDGLIKDNLVAMANSLADAGLLLGRPDSLKFLYEQFSVRVKRTHDNFINWTNIFQCFLDIIYWRRYNRVIKYINDNTKKFGKVAKDDIEDLVQQAENKLNKIRDKMRICKSICKTDKNDKECYYLCLLCKNHEDDNDWEDNHC